MASAIGHARELVRPDPVRADSHVPTRFPQLSFSSSKSLLFHAIRYGPMQTVRDLLNETPKLAQVTDNRGYTPLHYAALFGRPDMVRMLCRANAKIDAQDYSGNTPLHYSTAEMAEALLVANASIETGNLKGSTALHLAAQMGPLEKVRVLLEANADVRAQNKSRDTPLHYAGWAGHCEIVKLLLHRGADIDSRNTSGLTPLSFTVSKGCWRQSKDIVSLLLSANANIHIPDRDGNTASHHAALNQDSTTIKLLLKAGGNIKSKNSKGLNVWNIVHRPGRHEIKAALSEFLHECFKTEKLRECLLCCVDFDLGFFPQSSHLGGHDICKRCVRKYLQIKILDHSEVDLRCPAGDCMDSLVYDEVKQYCVQNRYDRLLLKQALESDPNFRYCANSTCSAGQIVDNGGQSSFFTCVSCRFKTCFQCRGAAHHPLTCEQHEAFLRAQLAPTDSRSLQWMSRYTRRCKCNVMVEKSEGCDHMTCSRCKAEWCWLCGADYNRIRREGNTAHARTCRYHA